MTSILSSATQTAHSLVTTLLATAQVKPGSVIPALNVKEDAGDQAQPLALKGRNVIVGVPGAFTDTCSKHVPGYIKHYEEFQQKGVNEVYVVTVNDVFVTKAWKKSLASQGTPVHFIADDIGTLTGSIGLLFDASKLLGGPRSKRYIIVTNDDKVETISVEEDPSKITTTAAENVLALL